MEKIRVAICEDNPEEQRKLITILEGSHISNEPDVFSSGEDFLQNYHAGKYGLVLMDIYMSGITGVKTIARLREIDEDTPVAFITTSTEHTLESYRLDVIKYIEKPVKAKAVNELLQYALMKQENTPKVTVKVNGMERSIPFMRILYVEQAAHHLVLYLTGGAQIQISGKLDNIQDQFEGRNFFRSHKSYLVNLAYVKSIDKELMVFEMEEGKYVHIRRDSLGRARKAYEAYLFDTARSLEDE